MGQINSKRIIILICCLLVTGIVIFFKPVSTISVKKTNLQSNLMAINGWDYLGSSSFDQKIVEALLLDDYVNSRYTDGEKTISLYIGYYASAKKIGAAHDPMVCFPGQGWKISNKSTGRFDLPSGEIIKYSTMFAELGQKKELIVYWFQSYDSTNSGTFSQKISLLFKKIFNQRENNAFVRITIPVENSQMVENKKTALNFIQNFYPEFEKLMKTHEN